MKITRLARFPQCAIGLAALSAIDHALWDISAIALNVPVYQLLGGRVRDRVPVYCGLYTAPRRRRRARPHRRAQRALRPHLL
ncbi:hypothetical protein GCM10010922_16410 [Microbacterium sorbitolivorans]|nr:hypothetical protein [Microbacterium sorbitolivorans]GGF41609.1 hypothetical protein GCM10010922_16410 [Microbacterium sorbitolivorans]